MAKIDKHGPHPGKHAAHDKKPHAHPEPAGRGDGPPDEPRKRFREGSVEVEGGGRASRLPFGHGDQKEARRDARYAALTRQDLKAVRRYDTDHDGHITRAEYGAGRDADWKVRTVAKIAENFERAGGTADGNIAAKGRYAGYDADHDGGVTAAEFDAGQRADRRQYFEGRRGTGLPDPALARRLSLDAHGGGVNRLKGPSGPTTPGADPGGPSDMVISSFNLLGSSHTAAGGKAAGMASGPERMKDAIDLLHKHKVDVVGFQEMEGNQLDAFQRLAGKEYGIYPGRKLGPREMANSIAWRKDKFELVKADHISIPYFNGTKRKMPIVLLRDKATGQLSYHANFHNPADTKRFHHQDRFRAEATRLEIAMANRLRKTGLPVFITGDMNESGEYHGKMTRGARGMHSSGPANQGIDWIFGSSDVTFTRHVRDRSAQVRHTTDHPMIVARAKIRNGRG